MNSEYAHTFEFSRIIVHWERLAGLFARDKSVDSALLLTAASAAVYSCSHISSTPARSLGKAVKPLAV